MNTRDHTTWEKIWSRSSAPGTKRVRKLTQHQKDTIKGVISLLLRRPLFEVAEELLFKNGKLSANSLRRVLEARGLARDRKTVLVALRAIKMNGALMDARTILLGEVEAALAGYQELNTQLLHDEQDSALRLEVGLRALTVARIVVNLTILEGRSMSRLPGRSELDEDERITLDLLHESGLSRQSLEPAREFGAEIDRYRTHGNLVLLGAAAVRAALVLLGEQDLAGLLARVQYAYMTQAVTGNRHFAGEMRHIRESVAKLDRDTADRVIADYPDFELKSCSSLTVATLMNEAGALAALIAQDESEAECAKVDFRRFAGLVDVLEQCCDDERICRIVRCEQLAVGAEKIDHEEYSRLARAFWENLGKEAAWALYGDIHEVERVGAVAYCVRVSLETVYPESHAT